MTIEIKSTHKLSLAQRDLTADILKEFLEPLEDDTHIQVRTDNSNRPGEASMVYFEADIDISKGRNGMRTR